MSTLRHEFGSNGREHFVTAAPHAWLLWAPGAWQPPLRQTKPLPRATGPTVESRPAAEALALALVPLTRPAVLGRAPDCDLIINDGRLSAHHLAFHFKDGGWAAEDLLSTNGTRVDEALLEPGELRPLPDGATIDAGQVVLVFLSSEGLWPKLMTS